MLQYFLATFVILGVCLFGMALGVVFSNKPLKGSCGGLGKIMGTKCMFCSSKKECKKKVPA